MYTCSYEHQEIALNCGSMLRECARYEALAKIMLNSEDFFNFFRYVEVSTFDIASDAFSTFKVSILEKSGVVIWLFFLFLFFLQWSRKFGEWYIIRLVRLFLM